MEYIDLGLSVKGRSDINLLGPTKYFISVRGVQ